jgi:hypothetical protein
MPVPATGFEPDDGVLLRRGTMAGAFRQQQASLSATRLAPSRAPAGCEKHDTVVTQHIAPPVDGSGHDHEAAEVAESAARDHR